MQLLIIPSEEFVPAHAPLAGIFQLHQAEALLKCQDVRIGVLSIRLRFSMPMYIKTILLRCIGIRIDNRLCDRSFLALLSELGRMLFRPGCFQSFDEVCGIDVSQAEGIYLLPPSAQFDHISWLRAGKVAFEAYVEKFGYPNLIHAHNAVNGGFLAREIKKKWGIPYVLTEHSSYYQQGLIPSSLISKVRKVADEAGAYLAVSPRLIDVLRSKLGSCAEKALYLPNVLPCIFDETADVRSVPAVDQQFTFLCVASLLPIKAHSLLLDAFAKLIEETGQELRLRLAGDGPLRTELEQKANSLGISEQVTFLGEIDSDAVKSEMLGANTLVLASHFETFGVVLIEAMAVGLPVVATACGGPEAIVTDECGVLVAPDSIPELVEGMRWALEHSRELNPRRIQSLAQVRYGGRVFSQALMGIYSQCLPREQAQAELGATRVG